MTDTVIVNGRLADSISVRDRGLAYGDGVFETILSRQGRLVLWPQHVERLSCSLSRLKIQPYETDTLYAQLKAHLDNTKNQVVKIIVTRGEAERGYRPPEVCKPNTIIFISDLLEPTETNLSKLAVKTRTCNTRLAYQPELAGLKHLNRLEQILAQAELADTDCSEGIMLGMEGEVIEATMHNLFLVNNGELYTPILTKCGVEGIMRGFVIEIARSMGYKVHVELISVEQLRKADDLFLTNSINGILPICELDGTRYKTGKVTCQLHDKVVDLT